MKTLLLANPEADGGRARRLVPRLRDFLHRHVPRLEFLHCRTAAELREAARAAAAGGYERVLVGGGDGTAHAAVNGLAGSSAALGLIPLGTGNDLCRSLGIPLDPISAAEFLVRAPANRMDVVSAGEDVFAGVGGIGFDAEANRRANSWPSWPRGHLRYWLAGFVTKLGYRGVKMAFSADGQQFEGEALWVAFANTPCYAGGLRIAPGAEVNDGLLDVCVVKPLSLAQLLDLYPALYRGHHLASPQVQTFRARVVEVHAPEGLPFYADGERLGRTPFRLEVEKGALRVLGRPGKDRVPS